MLPCRNGKDPGFLFIVRNDDGANYTADVVRVSIGRKSLVLDYETLVRVAEEADVVSCEDDGHDRWCSLVSCASKGLLREKQRGEGSFYSVRGTTAVKGQAQI